MRAETQNIYLQASYGWNFQYEGYWNTHRLLYLCMLS